MRLDFAHPETLPNRRVESWKYSDLRAAVREPLYPTPPMVVEEAPAPFGSALTGPLVNLVNGEGPSDLGAIQDVTKLRFLAAADGSAHEAVVAVRVAAGQSAVLIETHHGHGGTYASQTDLAIVLESGARLERIVFLDEPEGAVSVVRAKVTMAAGAGYAQTVLTSGARLQRVETHVDHPGGGAQVRLDGIYALAEKRHADLTSVVRHEGLNGVTSQLTKGVVRDTARGVFQGKIVVERGADGTDARMGHHALILGERAEVDAKPELEIYADDVSCAHGNTVGNLDESALFYMQQRGLPADEARALLTQAFLIEVVDRIEHEGAREVVREWLEQRL